MSPTGEFLELLSCQGKNWESQWTSRGCSKVFDKGVRSFVVDLCDGKTQLRKDVRFDIDGDPRALLLTCQIFVHSGRDFTLVLRVRLKDSRSASSSILRLVISSSFSSLRSSPLHTQVPIRDVPRGIWTQLDLSLGDYVRSEISTLESVEIYGTCWLRKMALRTSDCDVPQNFEFPPYVDFVRVNASTCTRPDPPVVHQEEKTKIPMKVHRRLPLPRKAVTKDTPIAPKTQKSTQDILDKVRSLLGQPLESSKPPAHHVPISSPELLPVVKPIEAFHQPIESSSEESESSDMLSEPERVTLQESDLQSSIQEAYSQLRSRYLISL